jgi:hypothetical protein
MHPSLGEIRIRAENGEEVGISVYTIYTEEKTHFHSSLQIFIMMISISIRRMEGRLFPKDRVW